MYQIQARRTTTGTAVAAASGFAFVVRGVRLLAGTAAGTVVLKDGGASGDVKATFAAPVGSASNDAATRDIVIPGDGIYFSTDVHATITNAAGIEIFYEKRAG
jgi:hypothetical protein